MLLEVDDIDAFHGDVQALWNVSLNVDDCECVCVLGSNGAGKTTLLSSIAGLLVPRRGAIRYAGERILGLRAHAISRRRLALVANCFQI
jgi:branched-chain amino acid transport system ATP-binding protein